MVSSQSLLRFRDFDQATNGFLLVPESRNQRTPATGVLVVRSITQPNAYSIRGRMQDPRYVQETIPFPDLISETFLTSPFRFWCSDVLMILEQRSRIATTIRVSRIRHLSNHSLFVREIFVLIPIS
jgi:hypothetical protein